MKYADLIHFDPIDSVIQLRDANDAQKEAELVRSYVMSAGMAEKLKHNMLSQLQLDRVIDNKGVLLVGNYGTGKSHLMSLVSAVARDKSYLDLLQNKQFAKDAQSIAGKFEILRIEIGASQKPLRDIIFDEVEHDFSNRGLSIEFPAADQITSNKYLLEHMMATLNEKYEGKGFLIVIDEFLDYLRTKTERDTKRDLMFLRELGEIVKSTRLRVIFGIQEKLFGSPSFGFVSEELSRVKDRFEQVVIRKEDTAYVVSERILKKTDEQKALVRDHLHKFSSYYSNMAERMEEYVELYPIHPTYVEVLNRIYAVENRHVLKNLSDTIVSVLDKEVDLNVPGVFSFDSYWPFIKDNFALRTDPNIKEVAEKSEKLEDIIERSFPKKPYKPLAIQIIHALSVYRLVTGDITMKSGLTAENLKDELCLFKKDLIDHSSDTLTSLVEVTLKDILKTVSGQFIDHNEENGQYYLDLSKDLDYDELIRNRAAMIPEDDLNRYYFDIIYSVMEWDEQEYVPNFKIYEHTLNWDSHDIFKRGYLFLGIPEDRPTAQPPRDYYVYFLPPFGSEEQGYSAKDDEVFFIFKRNEDFAQDLRLFAGASILKELADEKNRIVYHGKTETYRKKVARYLNENRNTCFEVEYKNKKRQLIEVLGGRYDPHTPFKETMDLAASLSLDNYFSQKYPKFPKFKTRITLRNYAETIGAGLARLGGKKTQLADAILSSLDLIEGDSIAVSRSRYAQYYLKKLEALPPQGVLNFSDIYFEKPDGSFMDKEFLLDNGLLSLVFLALVHAGYAVIKTKGKDISASDLEFLPAIAPIDIYEFQYLGKPKGLPLAELRIFSKILGLPEGLISNTKDMPDALAQLIKATQEEVKKAARLISQSQGEFSLWGEPLLEEVVAVGYRDSMRRFIDEFSSFGSRFNTVAKLQNFPYDKETLEKFAIDLKNIKLVDEYDQFRNKCQSQVLYVSHLENLVLPDELKEELEWAKAEFRAVRDRIDEEMDGEESAKEVIQVLEKVKKKYIDAYFEEHEKKRLNLAEGNRKGTLIGSTELVSLDYLKDLDIFSANKVDSIKHDLASIPICYSLTTEMLQTSPTCPQCHFMMGSDEPPAKNRLEHVELSINQLLEEWAEKLYNTLSDPVLQEQMAYLDEGQRGVVQDFLANKKLPEKLDQYFIEAVKTLLGGFETVRISAIDLFMELDSLGPSDLDTLKKKLDDILNAAAKGKDKTKLRIIIEQ